MLSAAWVASMVQVPVAAKVTRSPPLTVHMPVVPLVKTTRLVDPPPVALTVYVPP